MNQPPTKQPVYLRAALLWAAVLMFASGLCFVSPATAQTLEPTLEQTPRDLHVWGRFAVGTWKQVRIVTESLNGRGAVADTTTTETKTTLLRADSRRLTLRIEATVEVAGKRFESQPQIVEYGYFGESPTEPSEIKTVGFDRLTVEGQQVPCQVRLVTASSGQLRQVTRMYLSDEFEPFVLKRETTVLKDDGNTSGNQQTTAEVIAMEMPYRVLRQLKSAAYERTIQKTSRGTNITLDVTCVDVPGGIVARTAKELDAQGRLLRRSSMELVGYGVVVDENDEGSQFLTRRQARRARRH